MTSGQFLRSRSASWLGMVLVIAWSVAGAASAQSLDLSELLKALSRVERSTAMFEETRVLAALTAPIVRRGTLHYQRPDRIEMTILSPAPERIEIKGDALTLDARGEIKRVRLSAFPAIAVWIESIRATLAGDQQALGRHFRIGSSGRMSAWALELVPIDSDPDSIVNRIIISGTQAQLTRIEIVERGGDRSVMVITATDRRQ